MFTLLIPYWFNLYCFVIISKLIIAIDRSFDVKTIDYNIIFVESRVISAITVKKFNDVIVMTATCG